jgi:hypothetical protein
MTNSGKVKLGGRQRSAKLIMTLPMMLCLAGCVVILAMCLFANIELTRLSDETSVMQRAYDAACKQEARLKLDYERAFDMTELEQWVTARMGMRKPKELQVIYIGAEPGERVQVLRTAEGQKGLLGKLSDILSRLSEYVVSN